MQHVLQFITCKSTIEFDTTSFYLYNFQHHHTHTLREQHQMEPEDGRTDRQVKGQGAIVEGHHRVVHDTPMRLTQQVTLLALEGMMVSRLLHLELMIIPEA